MKIIRILEMAWLAIAVGAFALGAFKYYTTQNWDEAVYFFIFTLIAAIFYFIRRRQRINMEKEHPPGE
jgi:hypothetical protein